MQQKIWKIFFKNKHLSYEYSRLPNRGIIVNKGINGTLLEIWWGKKGVNIGGSFLFIM